MKRKLPTIWEQGADREYERAKFWRTNVARMTVAELAEATGYTIEAVYLMERGMASTGRKVKPWVWKRYKMACAGVDAALRETRVFNWQHSAASITANRSSSDEKA